MSARFDWYQATIEHPPLWLKMEIEKSPLGGQTWHDSRPKGGYATCESLYRPDGLHLLDLMHGGANAHPHIVATGAAADEAAALVRSVAPVHLVARADVCEDVESPGWFDQAFSTILEVAQEKRVKVFRHGEWDLAKARTVYLGSPTSAVRVRMYEKGAEMMAKHPAAKHEFSRDWVRMEIQVRPAKRESKIQMSRVPAADWWGCSGYSQQLADRLLCQEVPRLAVGTIWRASELERAEMHMIKQYKNVFERLLEVHGSWEAVGEHIGATIEREKRSDDFDLAQLVELVNKDLAKG